MERRHDIDWLRVVAIGLLILYHTAIGFQPWGVLIQFIQNGDSMEWIWYPMSMLNMWRIPILFVVSGMGLHFAMKKRSLTTLILERSKRILLPFVFGVLAIVPLHILLWQSYYSQDLSYSPEKGHLWFLWNIFTYVIILAPAFYHLGNKTDLRMTIKLKKYLKHPCIFILVYIVFIIETYITQPELYTFYAISWHGYFMGFLAFFFGYTFIELGQAFWKNLTLWKWFYLGIAFSLYGIKIFVFQSESPLYLLVAETISWIFGILGLFHQYTNKSSIVLVYLSKAAYPVYILHMFFLYLASYFIFPLEMPAIIKYILTVLFTYTGSFAFYEFVIRRIEFLKLLFGVKTKMHFFVKKLNNADSEESVKRL